MREAVYQLYDSEINKSINDKLKQNLNEDNFDGWHDVIVGSLVGAFNHRNSLILSFFSFESENIGLKHNVNYINQRIKKKIF